MITIDGPFSLVIDEVTEAFLEAPRVHVPHWQGLDVSSSPQGQTRELLNVSFSVPIPPTPGSLAEAVRPNLPWAEDQFKERVGGFALNPGNTYDKWPFWTNSANDAFKAGDGQFSHTYMERFWPRRAGSVPTKWIGHRGVRFRYGDYSDLLVLLSREPYTRQAYLPIFFPEDTGAHHGERIPCTLGYHLILRDDRLHLVYYIRSCDFMRHFRDDVYMAGRLAQHTIQTLSLDHLDTMTGQLWKAVKPGTLTMHITSFHIFEPDVRSLRRQREEALRG